MKNLKRITALWICTLLLALSLSGCNTMEGMGEDLEQGGQEVQDAAD